METTPETKDPKVPEVRIDPALNQYDNVSLFPEKLAKANAQLRKAGPPRLPERKE